MSINLSDIIIKCEACNFIASEYEFLPDGITGEQLVCPECGEKSALTDLEN